MDKFEKPYILELSKRLGNLLAKPHMSFDSVLISQPR